MDVVLDRVGAGRGAVVVVEGPAGIGKSEFLAAVRANAEVRGFGVLTARGSELEVGIAFGVARQLFEPMLRAASARERRRLVDGVARVGARALGVEVGEPPADRFAAFHGLYWLLSNRTDRGPVVVSVDDVQWADAPSLAWLGYVARRAEDLAVLLVLALRSGDPGVERDELKALLGDGRAERLVLGPLSAAAVGAIVRMQLDELADESFCAACSELTGGNPLFARELVVAAREEGLAARADSVPALRRIAPTAVGTSVLARLGRLGTDAVALARAVAVLGAGTEVVLAARLADLDPVVAELTADRLSAAQILAPVRPLEFFHPLIGAAVLEDIAPGARRVAHRRAAELVDSGAEGGLARVAAHLLACGPAGDAWVVERLRDAASEALARAAPEVAAGYARRALSEPPAAGDRAGLLELLGTAQWRAGQPHALAQLEEAHAAAGSDFRSGIALLALANAVSDRAARAIELLERALTAVGDANAGAALTIEAGICMVGMADERTVPAALRRAEALRDRLRTLPQPPVYVLVVLAYYATRRNHAEEAQELAARALTSEPYPPPLELSGSLIATLTMVECYQELRRLCGDLLAASRSRGALQETNAILASRAWASLDCGALADADSDARWALEHETALYRLSAVTSIVRGLIERDELEAAAETLELGGSPRQSNFDMPLLQFVRGQLRGAQGRHQEALDDFLECGHRCVRLGFARLHSFPWRGEAALAAAALGDNGLARQLAGEQLELARAFGRPRTLGISLRACGLIEGGDRGLELLREAVDTLAHSQSPLELARALSDYGTALRRAGRRVPARAELERALDLSHHCGARRIANQARAELIAAGAKPRRDAITGRDALTPAELRVARLAAQGLTNREIAQALFITTKTAKAHLNRVYRKLGITRRGQLADALTAVIDDGAEDASASVTAIS
ncbi:MAG: AAA family ATPase [Solirubrobacterales bacterium]|nr:AAA family ATPase [Solirubrobacterales bacterium]